MSMNSSQVYLLGAGYTHLRRWPKRDHLDLAQEALTTALVDAGLSEGERINRVWFGNCGMHHWGQANIRGQVVCAPLSEKGLLANAPTVINVEGGCATGSLAVYGAIGDILSGRVDIAVALGVEKTFIAHDPSQILTLFASGTNLWRAEESLAFYRQQATDLGLNFQPSPERISILDIAALHAQAYLKQHHLSMEDLAHVASKSHAYGALNPKAQYQTAMSVSEVMEDHLILTPFTRSMCAPISDGAAAAILISHEALSQLSPEAQARAIPILACETAGGQQSHWEREGATARAAQAVYRSAQLTPDQIDLVELHDATAFAELLHLEELRLCDAGRAASLTRQGETGQEGRIPVNLSGGLISKGHPLAASGIAMMAEVAAQLRGEAGPRQAHPSRGRLEIAMTHNGGGLLGFQEAAAVVTVFGKPS